MLVDNPPIELGQTLKGTDADGNLINGDKLGLIYRFPANKFTGGPTRTKGRITGKPIIAVLLRNQCGFALLPKRMARLKATAGYSLMEAVDGYSAGTADPRIVGVDSNLPSAGVADKDIFWGILSGPFTVLTPITNTDFGSDIAVGDLLVAATGTTTGVTTSGRLGKPTFVNATAGSTTAALNGFNMAAGIVAKALSARTTDNTASDLLVDLMVRY